MNSPDSLVCTEKARAGQTVREKHRQVDFSVQPDSPYYRNYTANRQSDAHSSPRRGSSQPESNEPPMNNSESQPFDIGIFSQDVPHY